jgi:hypothetical protein
LAGFQASAEGEKNSVTGLSVLTCVAPLSGQMLKNRGSGAFCGAGSISKYPEKGNRRVPGEICHPARNVDFCDLAEQPIAADVDRARAEVGERSVTARRATLAEAMIRSIRRCNQTALVPSAKVIGPE